MSRRENFGKQHFVSGALIVSAFPHTKTTLLTCLQLQICACRWITQCITWKISVNILYLIFVSSDPFVSAFPHTQTILHAFSYRSVFADELLNLLQENKCKCYQWLKSDNQILYLIFVSSAPFVSAFPQPQTTRWHAFSCRSVLAQRGE